MSKAYFISVRSDRDPEGESWPKELYTMVSQALDVAANKAHSEFVRGAKKVEIKVQEVDDE